jgi:hypothetical protein
MGRITGIQWYYHVQCLLFLFLTIYSFVFVSNFTDDKCLAKVETNSTRLLEERGKSNDFQDIGRILQTSNESSNSTTSNSTTSNETSSTSQGWIDGVCPTSTLKEKTSLVSIAAVLGFIYAALAGLMTFMSLFLYYFSNLDISEFADLSFCQNCMGKLTKCLPYLTVLGHLIGFILVVVQLFFVFVIKDCEDACHYDSTENKHKYGVMQDEAEILIIICALAWFSMHVIGGFARRNVYYDSFFYQPEMRANKCVLWCCTRCGP